MSKTNTKREKLLIYGLYAKLLSAGRHHGTLQTSYRIIASTWLLATFAAIGFLLSINEVLPFDHILGVALICFIGAFGLYLIWYEDTVAQEILLDINVIEGLRLEKKYPWLPQVHHRFLHLYKGNTSVVKVLFFIGCKSILLFIALISLSLYLYKFSLYFSLISIFVILFLNYISSKFMLYKASEINQYMEFLAGVDDRI